MCGYLLLYYVMYINVQPLYEIYICDRRLHGRIFFRYTIEYITYNIKYILRNTSNNNKLRMVCFNYIDNVLNIYRNYEHFRGALSQPYIDFVGYRNIKLRMITEFFFDRIQYTQHGLEWRRFKALLTFE